MTSGQYTPYLAGALTTSVAAFGLYSLKFVNMETASAIAVTGVAINALNLLANKGPFAKYLPAVGMVQAYPATVATATLVHTAQCTEATTWTW